MSSSTGGHNRLSSDSDIFAIVVYFQIFHKQIYFLMIQYEPQLLQYLQNYWSIIIISGKWQERANLRHPLLAVDAD